MLDDQNNFMLNFSMFCLKKVNFTGFILIRIFGFELVFEIQIMSNEAEQKQTQLFRFPSISEERVFAFNINMRFSVK